jgi:hypothetical protein
MKIIGVYDGTTEKYVNKQVTELKQLGYEADAITVEEAKNYLDSISTPSFFLIKNDKFGYALNGKHDFTKILQWVKNSGIVCK